MQKINKHIEIVRSSIPSLSSMGEKSCDMIVQVLSKRYERVEVSAVCNTDDLAAVVKKQPDLVFLGLKSLPIGANSITTDSLSEWSSAYFDDNGLNYTGSNAKAIALDFSKPIAKQVVSDAGLKTAAYFTASAGQYPTAADLPLDFPLFIKPQNTGGGRGIGADSVARDFEAFTYKVSTLTSDFVGDALVESYLPGREFSVAILENIDSDVLTVMPIEIITDKNKQGDRILGQKVKSDDTEHTIAVTNGVVRDKVVDLATKTFRALGARDYGRIDIRLDEQGVAHFLEANLIPGIAFHDFTSYFTSACWINEAMDYETMLLRIVDLALSRGKEKPIDIEDYLQEPILVLV
jgi:D-alanine-D-alanine ligase